MEEAFIKWQTVMCTMESGKTTMSMDSVPYILPTENHRKVFGRMGLSKKVVRV
jgi:hypothetical protein